jgi:hypothetical protein
MTANKAGGWFRVFCKVLSTSTFPEIIHELSCPALHQSRGFIIRYGQHPAIFHPDTAGLSTKQLVMALTVGRPAFPPLLQGNRWRGEGLKRAIGASGVRAFGLEMIATLISALYFYCRILNIFLNRES